MTTETTMKKREWRLCRVEAKPWKGMVASAPYHGVKALRVNKKRLVQVLVEGHAEAVTLKYSHLTFFTPGSLFEGSIQVTPGRFQCVASALHKGKRLWQDAVGGRASGNLMAMKAHLKAHVSRKTTREEAGVVVQCTDLNVAMAINRVSAGGEAALSPSHQELFQALQDQIRQLVKKRSMYKKIFKSDIKPRQNTSSSIICAKYRPQYLQPDNNFQKSGDARINAVKRGAFKIYPCPLFEHAMEVRYLDDTAADKLIVRQEIYLDYGAEEVESYVLNAVALGDTDRLLPATLTKVDPQAFWSVLLHMEKSREALQQSTRSQLCSQWGKMWQGVMTSQQLWLQEAGISMIASRMPQSIIRGDYLPDWGIANKRDHEDVSFACAYIALLVMIEAAVCFNQATKSRTMEFQMLECYNNTQIARFVSVVQSLMGRSNNNMKQVLEHAVFGKREDDTYLDFCGNCGNPAKQQYCGRCSGVAYCCRKCQVEDWKTHKKECSEVLAQTKRAVYRLHKKLGELDGHRDPA